MCEAVRQMCEDAAREAVIKTKAESEEALTKVKAESEKALIKVKAESEKALTKVKAESEEALKKVKKETEKKAVRNSFALLSGFNSDLCSDDIVNAIAEQFKINSEKVRKIVNS